MATLHSLWTHGQVNGAFYLLKFEVPAGYTAGINPGQHVKVHVPNISKDQPTWNTHMNLEDHRVAMPTQGVVAVIPWF